MFVKDGKNNNKRERNRYMMDRKILIVKNEDSDIRELIKILEDTYSIIIYRKEEDIYSIIKEEKPCTLLIDSSCIGKSEFQYIKQLRKKNKSIGIPLMFIIDSDDYEEQKRMAEIENVEYITRPYIPEIIKNRIHVQSELFLLHHVEEKQQEEQSEEKQSVNVNFLGEFSLRINDVSINAEMNRSKKMWQMLQYLIVYRDRQVTAQELIEVLWPDEQIEKPAFALKTLSYRMRKQLESLKVPYAKELIQSVDGGYVWNKDYLCEVDATEFEKVCREAENHSLRTSKRMALWEKAIGLYKGEYFIYSGLEHWLLHIQTYYYNLWLNAATSFMAELSKQEDYDKLIDVCTQCIQHDKLNEEFQYYFLLALLNKKNNKEVIEYYEHLVKLFKEELETKPSKKIEQLYLAAILAEQQSEEGIKQYQKRKSKKAAKPYFCDVETFKSLYEVEQHRMTRSEKVNHLICFIIEGVENKKTNFLQHAIMESLRSSEVVTCVNKEKYLIFVESISEKQCEVIVQRIFGKIDTKLRENIKYSIQKVLPNKSLGI